MEESSYADSLAVTRNQAHGFHHQKQTGNIAVATAHSVRSSVPQQEIIPQEKLYEKQLVGTSNLDKQDHPDELWSSSTRHGEVGNVLPTPALDNGGGPNSCNHGKNTVAETDSSIVPKATPSPPKTAFMCFSISRTKGADSTKVRSIEFLCRVKCQLASLIVLSMFIRKTNHSCRLWTLTPWRMNTSAYHCPRRKSGRQRHKRINNVTVRRRTGTKDRGNCQYEGRRNIPLHRNDRKLFDDCPLVVANNRYLVPNRLIVFNLI